MTLVKARLISRTTHDGWDVIEEHVPLGKLYLIDLDSKEMLDHGQTGRVEIVEREHVQVYDYYRGTLGLAGWMPLELLEVLIN